MKYACLWATVIFLVVIIIAVIDIITHRSE